MQVESKVLSEEFRQEANGKYMLLGIYRTGRVVNNLPKEKRWNGPMCWCFFAGVKLDRSVDAGHYVVKSISTNGSSLMSDISLEIKAEGDDFVQLPIRVIMDMKGPGEIIVNVCKVDSGEVYCELGRFTVVEND
jgi:hypothetical protein